MCFPGSLRELQAAKETIAIVNTPVTACFALCKTVPDFIDLLGSYFYCGLTGFIGDDAFNENPFNDLTVFIKNKTLSENCFTRLAMFNDDANYLQMGGILNDPLRRFKGDNSLPHHISVADNPNFHIGGHCRIAGGGHFVRVTQRGAKFFQSLPNGEGSYFDTHRFIAKIR